MYNGGQQDKSGRPDPKPTICMHCKAAVQSAPRQAGRTHRGLRAGHVDKGVIRELGRASRLRGSNSRTTGDRLNQHPGSRRAMRPTDEPNLVQARRNTNSASTQGTGREPKADRPGRTKAVVATHSTAGLGATPTRMHGEPRPKGPTIKAVRLREGNARYDVNAKERQFILHQNQSRGSRLGAAMAKPQEGGRGTVFGALIPRLAARRHLRFA